MDIEQEILQALAEELSEKMFEAEIKSKRIWVKNTDFSGYSVTIVNNCFEITSHDVVGNDESVVTIPLEHPNAITAVFRNLDRRCSYGRARRRQAFSF